MTAQEINNYFDLLYSNLTNYEGAGFSAKEKSLLLTYAQVTILDKYMPIAESKEEYKKYLLPLKVTTGISPLAGGYHPYCYTAILPTNHRYTLSEGIDQIFLANSKCFAAGTSRRMDIIKAISSDYYGANINNPFKKPYYDLVWRWDFSETSRELIGDGTYIINWYHLTYYKLPNPIIVPYNYTSSHGTIKGVSFAANTAGLASEVDYLHQEIVQEAVRMATSATKDQLGYQIQNLEKQLQ